MQLCKKVRNSRNIVSFQCFVIPIKGWQVGSRKQHVQSQLARWKMKNRAAFVARNTFGSKTASFGALLKVQLSKKCTPMWREAHLQTKMYKTPHAQTTFGNSHVTKLHAVVARSTCRHENGENTAAPNHLLEVEMSKTRRCGAMQISKSKCWKRHTLRPLLDVQMSKKCAKHIWKSKM